MKTVIRCAPLLLMEGLKAMCLGIPMRVMEQSEGWAMCEGRGEVRRVGTLLLEDHGLGDWVLVHLDNAIRVLDETEARQISDAIEALDVALSGGNFDHLFADLVGREPELPQALRTSPNEIPWVQPVAENKVA